MPTSNAPRYVINTPMVVVSEDSSSEMSDDGDLSPQEVFPKPYFKAPFSFFKLCDSKKEGEIKRGQIQRKRYRPSDLTRKNQCLPRNQALLANFIGLCERESFARTDYGSIQATEKRLSIVIGLNMLHSLSTKKNNTLRKAVNYLVQSSLSIKKFGFFWQGVWLEKKLGDTTKEFIWEIVSYKRVHDFYRQLKRRNPRLSKEFRKKIEHPDTLNYQVPYREIRETIKDDKTTRKLVRQFRKFSQNSPIYLAIMDSDAVSLQSGELGCYSVYGKMIEDHYEKYGKPLEIASVGYLFSDDDEIMALSSQLDLSTRHHTAEYFKLGIVFPEPTIIMKIRPEEATITDSFCDNQRNYPSPQESIMIVQSRIVSQSLDPETSMAFSKAGAIISQRPRRAWKDFKAHNNKNDKIVRWTLHELKKMRSICQSHFKIKSWADNLIRALKFKGQEYPITIQVTNGPITISNKKAVRDVIISILTRIFRHYDAISNAESIIDKSPSKSFQKEFIKVLEEYDAKAIGKSPLVCKQAKGKKSNNSKYPPEKERSDILKVADSIKTMPELKALLDKLIAGNKADNIERAAIASHKKVVKIFLRRLCCDFHELSAELARDYFIELESRNRQCREQQQFAVLGVGTELHEAILYNNVLDHKDKYRRFITKLDESKRPGFHGMMPLHWAAITGNKEVIKWLKQNIWIKDINRAADYGVMPLHCAIKYCADNGLDPKLIDLLISPENVRATPKGGVSPLVMALTEFQDDFERDVLLSILFREGACSDEVKGLILELLKKSSADELETPILAAIAYLDDPLPLIEELIEQGADLNQPGFLHHPITEVYSFNDRAANSREFYPILEAIAKNDKTLIEALLKYLPNVTGIKDNRDRPPLHIAQDYAGLSVVKLLINACSDKKARDNMMREVNPLYGVTLLHESIASVNGGMGFDKDLFDYILEGYSELDCKDEDGAPCDPLDYKDEDGFTPLQVALEGNFKYAVRRLIEAGAYVDEDDSNLLREIKSLLGKPVFKQLFPHAEESSRCSEGSEYTGTDESDEEENNSHSVGSQDTDADEFQSMDDVCCTSSNDGRDEQSPTQQY